MKIRNGFVIREVGGKKYAVATGDSAKHFKGMLTLNNMGVTMFDLLKTKTTEEEIVDKILAEYEVDRATVEKDVNDFIAKLKEIDVLED